MFEHLERYRLVIVSGPHRSGTTICAKMIAQDTGKTFYPEESFGPDNHTAWREMVESASGVMQCPSMACYLGELGGFCDVAVVMMRRDLAAVQASHRKIGWSADGFYHLRYCAELGCYGAGKDEDLAEVKYRVWKGQRLLLQHACNVEYESLEEHPLWVSREKRTGWGPRQIE
jgi:hypothetical protein